MGVNRTLPQTGQTISSCSAMKASISSKLMASTFTSGVLLTDQLVGAVACLAGAAVQQGSEKLDTWPVVTQVCGFMMQASNPRYRGFPAQTFSAMLFDVVLELRQGAVVPAVGQTTVDLGTRGTHNHGSCKRSTIMSKGLFALFHCSILSVPAGLPCRQVLCAGGFPPLGGLAWLPGVLLPACASTVYLLYHVLPRL